MVGSSVDTARNNLIGLWRVQTNLLKGRWANELCINKLCINQCINFLQRLHDLLHFCFREDAKKPSTNGQAIKALPPPPPARAEWPYFFLVLK